MIKQFFSILISVFVFQNAGAQGLEIYAGGGMMNYGGDLQDKLFTFNQSHGAFTIGAGYRINGHFAVALNYTGGKVSASDMLNNPENARRNLSFYSNISEGSLMLHYNFIEVPAIRKITPYITAGIAYYHFDPYTFTKEGEKVYLEPLRTEGQGLAQYPERKPYKLSQFAIPVGGGITYALSEKVKISAEVAFRMLSTDHLDDVSNLFYADTAILRSQIGDLSAKMSFRSDETDNPLTFDAKLKRGNPEKKDVYYTCLIKLTFSLSDIISSSLSPASKRMIKQAGCPPKVL